MMELKRLPDWRKRLAAALIMRPTRDFEWGKDDCVLGLVVPAIQAMTGRDMGAEFRGSYDNETGAAGVLASLGHSDLGDAIAERLPEIHPSRAHIGDVALIPSGRDGAFPLAAGIVNGERIVVVTPSGTATAPLTRAVRAFRVG